MGMNKSKGNMYEWVTHTWNPLAGACPHKCSYCSTKKLMRYPKMVEKYNGEPRLHESEMSTNLGKDNFIFVAAQNDLFAMDVPETVIVDVIDHCKKYPDNRYLFQSKNPERMWLLSDHLKGINSVLCTTIETNRVYSAIMKNCPRPLDRARWMLTLSLTFETYVTIEPIMDFNLLTMLQMIQMCKPKQVNVGADTGKRNLPEPSFDKVMQLIDGLGEFTTVSKKSNLARLGVE